MQNMQIVGRGMEMIFLIKNEVSYLMIFMRVSRTRLMPVYYDWK